MSTPSTGFREPSRPRRRLADREDPQATATFRNHALDSLRELLRICDTAGLGEWPVTEQGDIFAQISRLYGQDDWTSGEIMQSIDGT